MPIDGVEAALSLPLKERAKAILGIPEDQWFERKSIRTKPRQLAEPLSAFANAEGGTIVVGVWNGRVEGIRHHSNATNSMRQAPLDFTKPPVRARFEEISVLNDSGETDELLVIRVSPGDVVHELQNGEAYLRIGDESRKLAFAQRQELHYDRGGAPFDGGSVTFASPTDLQGPGLDTYRSAVGATLSDDALLQARSLLTPNGDVTVAGYLLFHQHPQNQFPHAHVRVLRFDSDERGTGSRLSLRELDETRFDGPIPDVIKNSAAAIDRLVPKRRALRASGHFEAVPIVPRDAWLEGLVNAVVHRSYSYAGDHIRVEIYPSRVEIESPGRFPGLIDPHGPEGVGRYARNPRIARVCADLRLGQELGEGIPRIFDEMRAKGLAEPRWQQTPASVRLVLDGSPAIDAAVKNALPRGAADLLDLLRDAGRPLGTGQLMELSGISRPTVRKMLAALQDHGLIEWVGLSPQDPRAVWRVASTR